MVQILERPRQRTDLTRVDLRLALTDDVVGDLPIRIKCPRHSDTDPSLCVYPDHLYCYSVGCGFCIPTSKRMEALAWLLWDDRSQWRRAISESHKYTNSGIEAYRERVEREAKSKPLPRAQAELYHRLVYKERRNGYRPVQWYYDRGLSDQTISRFMLGHDGTRFTIPIFDHDGKLLNIRLRLDERYTTEDDYVNGKLQKKYSGVCGYNGVFLYPAWLIDPRSEEVIICEGELDCVKLHQEGYTNSITSTNGAGNLRKLLEGLTNDKNYATVRKLSIITDQDEAGDYVAAQLLEEAQKLGYAARRITWPREWGKDVTELYQGGHSLKEVAPFL